MVSYDYVVLPQLLTKLFNIFTVVECIGKLNKSIYEVVKDKNSI
jgi:hypothetical protein